MIISQVFPCSLGYCAITMNDNSVLGIDLAFSRPDLNCILADGYQTQIAEIDHQLPQELISAIDSNNQAHVDWAAKSLFQSGSTFSSKVWEALKKIPHGTTVSYQDLAINMGSPKAYRAVGTACGNNAFAVIVPCHRVMGKSNPLAYKWGSEMKKLLLKREGIF